MINYLKLLFATNTHNNIFYINSREKTEYSIRTRCVLKIENEKSVKRIVHTFSQCEGALKTTLFYL